LASCVQYLTDRPSTDDSFKMLSHDPCGKESLNVPQRPGDIYRYNSGSPTVTRPPDGGAVTADNADGGTTMTTIQLKVQGMKCGGCENNVREAVAACPGIRSVNPSHKQGTVDIDYDETSIDVPQIRKAITDRGFSVTD
jgi:copper chaperone CopZ